MTTERRHVTNAHDYERLSTHPMTRDQALKLAEEYGMTLVEDPKVLGQWLQHPGDEEPPSSLRYDTSHPRWYLVYLEWPKQAMWSEARRLWVSPEEYEATWRAEDEDMERRGVRNCDVCGGSGRLRYDHPLAVGPKHKCSECGGGGHVRADLPLKVSP